METENDDSHILKFENLMILLESSFPSWRLHKREIERQFSKLMHTPDHPPYASMIQRAIRELNQLGGSSEETISKFIEREYEDLPFSHASLLRHHLQKLVKKGDIYCTPGNSYILTNESSDFSYKLKKEQKHLRRRCRKGRQNGRQHKVKRVKSQKQKKFEESREKTQVNGTIGKELVEQKPAEGYIGPTGEQENERYAELIEQSNEMEETQFKVTENQVEAEQNTEGNEEHKPKQDQQKQQQKEMGLLQIQVIGETSEVFVDENNKAEDKNHAENHNGVAEVEQKELDKEVMEEQQIQVPAEGYIGPENEGSAELIKEHSELEEIQSEVNEQVEAEQCNEGNEGHNQKQEQQKKLQRKMDLVQIQVLGKTSEVLVEKKNQAEGKNQAENYTGVGEAEHLKELDKKKLEEQKNEKLEEKNIIQDKKGKASEEQVQLLEIQMEGMVELLNPQPQQFKVTEEKRIQSEVCCQIIDLSNMFVQFLKKEKGEHASMSGQNDATSKNVSLLSSLHLSKTELRQLLKKTNKVRGKLMDSLKLEVSENNESNPKRELLEEHVLHLKPCKGQTKEEQQLEACSKLKVSEHQPKPTPASEDVTELPTHKRMPEVEITSLEELFYKQNKQINVSKKNAPTSQPVLSTVALDVPFDSSCRKNENKHMANKRVKTVPVDNSLSTKSHSKFSRHANTFMLKIGESYMVKFVEQLHKSRHGSTEKLTESQLVTNSLNVLQELNLEHRQRTTFSNEVDGLEYKHPPENSIKGSLSKHEQTTVEKQFQPQQQMLSNSQLAADTLVAKQMQKQHQQTGRRPSERDPVLMTIEANHDSTLGLLKKLKQESISSTKRMQEPKPKTVVELSQPIKLQKNQCGQKKRPKSWPTETAVDSTITSVQHAKDQLQQRHLCPQGQGRSQTAIKQKTRELYPVKLQKQGNEQPKSQGRGRPPKLKTNEDATLVGSLVMGHQSHNEEQPKRRRQGRPPKSRLSTGMDASLAPQHQCMTKTKAAAKELRARMC